MLDKQAKKVMGMAQVAKVAAESLDTEPTTCIASFTSVVQGGTKDAFNKFSYWLLSHCHHYLFNCVGHPLFTLFLLSGYFVLLWLFNLWMWIYNSIQKKITFSKSRKYHPVHHYHLKRRLPMRQFSSIPSVKKFMQDFVPGNWSSVGSVVDRNLEHCEVPPRLIVLDA